MEGGEVMGAGVMGAGVMGAGVMGTGVTGGGQGLHQIYTVQIIERHFEKNLE